MKIVVAGGTGFIGQPLTRDLVQRGHEVVVLSRHSGGAAAGAREATWDGHTQGAWAEALRGAGAVVNLAGASIGAGRWTESRKRVLRDSRL
ncbi:MAG TPA: NAD-dependent epimerase/dehydratase family protein, partial [Chloroflexota bacterium]|nr:NAD-dependent epimerase/dehydratase family protein [Chloroflexota bacterium]